MTHEDDEGRTPPSVDARAAAEGAIGRLLDEMTTRGESYAAKAPAAPVSSDPLPHVPSLEETLQAGLDRIRREDAERRALPCFVAMYPGGAPDGYVDDRRDHAETLCGAMACRASGAEASCRYTAVPRVCSLRQHEENVDRTRLNLRAAGVEEHEHKLIMAAARGESRLQVVDALSVVRAFLRHAKAEVTLGHGAEINTETRKATPGLARFYGTERLLVLGGTPGRGKTLAACYAIGRVGGLYVTEYALARPRDANLEQLKRAPGILVVDQVGRAVLDERRTSALALEEVVDRRVASRLDTVLVPNMTFAAFADRYGVIFLDRIGGFGTYVDLAGPSMRPAQRKGKTE